jgi:hypothetical protein
MRVTRQQLRKLSTGKVAKPESSKKINGTASINPARKVDDSMKGKITVTLPKALCLHFALVFYICKIHIKAQFVN